LRAVALTTIPEITGVTFPSKIMPMLAVKFTIGKHSPFYLKLYWDGVK
jgi:hypothetical protein